MTNNNKYFFLTNLFFLDLEANFQPFNSVLSLLSYLCKAPLVERGANVVNALFKQRSCIENILKAFIALPANNNLELYFKCSDRSQWYEELKQPILKGQILEQPIAPINGVISGH